MHKQNHQIKRACEHVGSQSQLAKLLGVSPPTVNQWVHGSRPVPNEQITAIERITKHLVTRQDLRPDDYWLIWPDLKAPKSKKARAI